MRFLIKVVVVSVVLLLALLELFRFGAAAMLGDVEWVRQVSNTWWSGFYWVVAVACILTGFGLFVGVYPVTSCVFTPGGTASA